MIRAWLRRHVQIDWRKQPARLADRIAAWWNRPGEPWKVTRSASGEIVGIVNVRGARE